MNTNISVHGILDAEFKRREYDGYEVITLKVIDADKNHLELAIFSEDEKFPANILEIFGVKR